MPLQFSPDHLLASPGGPWLALFLWIILIWTAATDARTGRVPDWPLLGGAVVVALTFLALQPAGLLLSHILAALVCGGLIWAINEIWYYARGHDALGMGDAKWSMLAVFGFGAGPVLWGWAIAAWLALGFLGIMRLRKKILQRVYFAPFLCAGLAVAKLWLH